MKKFKRYVVVLTLFLNLSGVVEAKALNQNLNTYLEINETVKTCVFREVDEARSIEMYKDIIVDKITNDKTFIKGKTFKDAVIKFYINDMEYVSSTDEEGNFVLLLEEGFLVEADQVNIRVYDYLNNELSNLFFAVHDVLPPIDPNISFDLSNSDDIIKGYGEPNSSIKVIVNDKEFVGHTFSDGSFNVEVGDSLKEANNVKLIAYDCFNNYSNLVEKEIKDIIPPLKPTINIVDSERNLIIGTGESNCDVIVNLDEKIYRSRVDDNGNFVILDEEGSINSLNIIKVKLVDSSGNNSEEAYFELEKGNIGKIVLKSLDLSNDIIKDAIIKVNGPEHFNLNEDQVFNLNSEGILNLEDLPFGEYDIIFRYRKNDYSIEENNVHIILDELNSEVEVLID